MNLLQVSDDKHTILVVIKTIANLVADEKICLAFLNEDIEKHLGTHFTNSQSDSVIRQFQLEM